MQAHYSHVTEGNLLPELKHLTTVGLPGYISSQNSAPFGLNSQEKHAQVWLLVKWL